MKRQPHLLAPIFLPIISGKASIELAAKKKWADVAQALASVESIGKTYQPELWLRAISSRNVKILGALLSLGVDINARWKTYTALTTAAASSFQPAFGVSDEYYNRVWIFILNVSA